MPVERNSENEKSGDLQLHIQFRFEKNAADADAAQEAKLTAKCGNPKMKVFDLTKYLNAWDSLPPLQPLAPFAAPKPAPGAQAAEAQFEEIDPAAPQA